MPETCITQNPWSLKTKTPPNHTPQALHLNKTSKPPPQVCPGLCRLDHSSFSGAVVIDDDEDGGDDDDDEQYFMMNDDDQDLKTGMPKRSKHPPS